MSEVLRSFFSYQVAVGSTMSEYMQVVDMRKSSVTSRSSFPSGASSCHTTSDRLLLAVLAEILAHHAVLRAEQMLEEILVAFAGRAQQIGAPDEKIARPVFRIVGIVAGQLQLAGLQSLGDIVLRLQARRGGLFGDFDRIGLQLRRRRQPAHALGAHVVVDQRAVPRTRRRRRRENFGHIERLVAPLIGVGVKCRGRIHLPRRAAPVEARRRAAASRSADAAFPGRHNATSRRRIDRRIRTSPAC